MKHLVSLLALVALLILGTAAMAEPITNASDSVPVSVYIAPWVWVDVTGNLIYIDVEAGETGASASAPFICGANDHAHIYSSYVNDTVPAGVTVAASLQNLTVTSGTATWSYFSGTSEVCMNWPDSTTAGTLAGDLVVDVSDVDITDRAGLYAGTAYATITAF